MIKNVDDLKELVLKSGFSLRGLGRETGISSGYIVQLVNGCRNPSPITAKKITDALGVTFDDIFYIKNAHKSDQKNKTA